jgi:hypothetical protein
MAKEASRMRDNQSGIHDRSSCSFCSGEDMSIAAEMQAIVQGAAMPVTPGETVKAQQRRAWEALGRPRMWRLRAAWYGEAGCWGGRAIEDLRRRECARCEREANAREHAHALGTLYAGIADRLCSSGTDEDRGRAAALLDLARRLGAEDRALGRP